MTNKKIDFKNYDFLFFPKKDSLNAETKEYSCLWYGTAAHLVSLFCNYALENGIKHCEFDVQYVQNGMVPFVLIYCKEYVDKDNTNVYLVAAADKHYWDVAGWGTTKFELEETDDEIVISDEILIWKKEWEDKTKKLMRIK